VFFIVIIIIIIIIIILCLTHNLEIDYYNPVIASRQMRKFVLYSFRMFINRVITNLHKRNTLVSQLTVLLFRTVR